LQEDDVKLEKRLIVKKKSWEINSHKKQIRLYLKLRELDQAALMAAILA